MKHKVTRLDYCQFLLSSQINYTLTHFAEHSERFSHDAINRYMAGDHLPPRLVWENVRGQIVTSLSPEQRAYFDEMVGKGMKEWNTVQEPADVRGLDRGTKVAVMTYAADLFILE